MQHRGISLLLSLLVLLPTLAIAQSGIGIGHKQLVSSDTPVIVAEELGSSGRAQIFPMDETLLVSADGQSGGQTSSSSGQKKSSDEPPWDWARGVSVGLGYQYNTGSPGIGGLNLGGGWRWKDQIEATTDLDFGTVTSILGGINSKTKRQNYLFGGRYYLGKIIKKHSRWEPFGHLMYGWSHQSITTTEGIPVTTTISTSETTWAWDFGGGVDYLLSKHWALRGRADWLKTHYSNASQSHFKWVAGFWYSFSARSVPK
jgi:hypothetical protein